MLQSVTVFHIKKIVFLTNICNILVILKTHKTNANFLVCDKLFVLVIFVHLDCQRLLWMWSKMSCTVS